jgi:hypothetical protein
LLANLPGLRAGEPGFTTDSYDLYVGIDSTTANNQFVGSGRFWSVNTSTVGSGVNLVEGTDNGTSYITLKSPDSLAGIVTYTFPASPTNGYYLKTNATGELSWGEVVSTFDISADSGTADTVSTGQTITFAGTAGEIETSVTNNTLTFGLPTEVNLESFTASGISTFTNSVIFDSTGSIQIPKGTTGERPTGVLGQIRYNTTLSTFEGYGAGNAWGSLGGVKDVDGDTKITSETSAGSDEDTISIFTGGTVRTVVDSVGDVGIGTLTPDTAAHSGNTAILNVGVVTANNYYGEGGKMTLGSASDGSLVTPGALNTFSSSSTIVNSIDDLNELALNMMNSTAVSGLDFSSGTTSGGSPFSVTLTTSASGNPNSYYIDWGDGNTETTSDSTPSHTYTEPDGGQFSVSITASNTSGTGAGSSFTTAKSNFITVYTGDPSVSFDLFRASTGGSALTGNDLYVVEGQSLYLDNNTTNTSVGAGVTYTIDWGDGSSVDYISSDTVGGGASTTAARLQHTWSQGTNSGTSRDTFNLTLHSHSTADPSAIPTSGTATVKVYDDAPTAPDGLSSKTLSNVSSTGTSPRLASGFSDNTGGATIAAGDSVNRITSGTATAGPITTYAYNGDSGTLTANVNGSSDGSRGLTSGDDSGTYTSLVIDSESDYNLLNSGGSSTTFANSIYYPGLYKGFIARVAKSVASMSTGANSMGLTHSATGSTNTVEFVKDDLTSSPTVNVGSASVTENTAGTYRYISGIPYYNSGSPDLTLSGVTIDDLVGQCYTNQTDIVEVDDGTNQEGTSSNAISNSNYTYAQIDGASSMLTGGIPNSNTGTASAYSIGNLTVPINSSSVRTVSRVKVRAKNVNGTSSYSSDLGTNIQVHTASQSGISEIAIEVADALGSFYDDDAIRVFDFSSDTTDTPSYTNSTNFYTNSVYSESSDPGIAATREAILRLGNIKHDETDYSSGYLPAGPDLSSNRSGTQYFTFAFRRRTTANFNISITSSGISGLWIAAPGTDIDSSSTINGWLRADQAYAGSGVPGADTGNGGNGSNGCAATSGDIIASSTSLSGSYTMTLGSENLSNATGNVALVRIALASGQSVTSLSIS